jgi:HTH-type transcriptional regulator/antitoxin HigA
LARYLRTEELILSLSNELEINPAIIAGRIRKEANNYLIFGNLVGQGEVRKYFSDVHFG